MNVGVNSTTKNSVNLVNENNNANVLGNWNFNRMGKRILVNAAIVSVVATAAALVFGVLATQNGMTASCRSLEQGRIGHNCLHLSLKSNGPVLDILDHITGRTAERAAELAACEVSVNRVLSLSENIQHEFFNILGGYGYDSYRSLYILSGIVLPEVIREAILQKKNNSIPATL